MKGRTNGACVRMLRITLNLRPKIRRLNDNDVNVTYAQPHSRTTYVNYVKSDGCSVVHTFALAAPPIEVFYLYAGRTPYVNGVDHSDGRKYVRESAYLGNLHIRHVNQWKRP